jgi:hypothetical protein
MQISCPFPRGCCIHFRSLISDISSILFLTLSIYQSYRQTSLDTKLLSLHEDYLALTVNNTPILLFELIAAPLFPQLEIAGRCEADLSRRMSDCCEAGLS